MYLFFSSLVLLSSVSGKTDCRKLMILLKTLRSVMHGDYPAMPNCPWWAYLDSNQGPTGYEPVALAS